MLEVSKFRAEDAMQFPPGAAIDDDPEDDLTADLDWEWIYEESELLDLVTRSTPSPRKRKAADASLRDHGRHIVGARQGRFEARPGEIFVLQAGSNELWVAILHDLFENDDGEMLATFQWLSPPKEIRNRSKRRTDALPNEVYATADFDQNSLDTILGRAMVLSPHEFHSRYPTGRVPTKGKKFAKVFICRRGCNTRTATFTEEFVWEEVYRGVEDLESLQARIEKETKATRKRKTEPRSKRVDEFVVEDVANDFEPKTPSKKRKLDTNASKSTTKARTPLKFNTPTQKRIITKKPLEFTPLGTRILSPHHHSSPFQLARSQLHVSSVPTALPCREEEFSQVFNYLESAITAGTGSCIYISGTPGTGKTATVREVVSSLSAAVEAEELDDFIFVEINGMKVTDPHQSYSLLWEALTGDRLSPNHALSLLEREFSNPSPRRVPCVVLMDELDQLVTKTQSVMYNFFNWPGLRHSRLIVLAVANTMDLPERTLSNKISSRLGLTRITFPGYTHEQLIKIIESRLSGVPGNIVDPDAVQFASRKVAQVSGDARRALDICRRAVEIAEQEAMAAATVQDAQESDENDENQPPDTPSKKPKKSAMAAASDKPAQPKQPLGRVTIATVQRAIREATTSPMQRFLRVLPLASKVFLAAVLARVRRTGLAECVMGDVVDEAAKLARMSSVPSVRKFLLCRNETEIDDKQALENVSSMTPTKTRAVSKKTAALRTPRVLAMGAAAMELVDGGLLIVEGAAVGGGRKGGERTARVRLIVGEEEVKLALRGDEEVAGMGFS